MSITRRSRPTVTTADLMRMWDISRDAVDELVTQGTLRPISSLRPYAFLEEDIRQVTSDSADVKRAIAEVKQRAAQLRAFEEFVRWITSLDRPDRAHERQRVTLNLIIQRARAALDVKDERNES